MADLTKKVPFRREQTGHAATDRLQRTAQQVAQQSNSFVDVLRALTNRAYAALTTDTGTIAVAAYADLLTANITTVLASGFLIITASMSGVQLSFAGTASFQVLVDGVVIKGCYATVAAGGAFAAPLLLRVPVSRGPHVVKLQWKTSVANARINAASVLEEHASLLVQEAA